MGATFSASTSLHIVVDNNICIPGDIVTGAVFLNVAEELRYKKLEVQVGGLCQARGAMHAPFHCDWWWLAGAYLRTRERRGLPAQAISGSTAAKPRIHTAVPCQVAEASLDQGL